MLPSANLSVNLRQGLLIVRAAAAKVMSRPQLSNLTPGGTLTTTGTLSITGGNPTLKPFRAKTLDASFEWYFDKNAFLGLGLFQKKIDTYIQTREQRRVQEHGPADVAAAGELHRRRSVPGHARRSTPPAAS